MPTHPTHVVLGGTGTVGRETVRALVARGQAPVSVARRPATVEGARSVTADLREPTEVARVVRGADVVYLAAGLPYSARAWARDWPAIVGATIAAATRYDAHVVYLDNVYAYGHVPGPMTEDTPVRPCSRKGQVRADALRVLGEAAAAGLSLTIARSADFYGPGARTSVFNTFALDKIVAGRTGTWLFDADQPHSLTYTPDIGDALALLGTTEQGRGRTWHLPTAPPLTGRQYIELAAGPGARVAVTGYTAMRAASVVSGPARETMEMAYQYTAPYELDSTAFEAAFGVRATPTAHGVAATLEAGRRTR